jgi:hypothetical protein
VPADCVAWGSFSGGPAFQTATNTTAGSPASPAGITAGQAIRRTIEPGCPTLLEESDDTNDSATDFSSTSPPAPRNNASAILETPCFTPPSGSGPTTTVPTQAFDLKAAIAKCKKKFPKGPKRKKCIKKAKRKAAA